MCPTSFGSAFKPARHDCGHPDVGHVRCRWYAGAWVWFFFMAGTEVAIGFCPFCSLKLPERRERKLEIVRERER